MAWVLQATAAGFWNGRSEESQRWFSERLAQLGSKGFQEAPIGSPQAAFLVSGARSHQWTFGSIAQRLADSGSSFLIPRSPASDDLIRSLLSRQRRQSELLMAFRALYFPSIEKLLAEHGLPMELKYLAMAASALNPGGRYSDGRAGLWGFPLPTARLYGLRIDEQLDERLDPERSTQAALRRLQDLEQTFGDWPLVIAAHGGGPAAVQRAIQREGGSRRLDRVAKHLPAESQALLDAFAASFYLDRFHAEHGLRPAAIQFPRQVQAVSVDRPMELKQAAQLLDTRLDTLEALNPHWLQGRIHPFNGTARLRLPADLAQTFPEVLSSLPAPETQADPSHPSGAATVEEALTWRDSRQLTVYRIRPGDSLGRISNRFGVSISEIRQWNGLRGNLIIAGQDLEIRAPDRASSAGRSAPARASQPLQAPQGAELHWHRVRAGETLGGIAERYRVRTSHLRRWNGLRGDLIYAGRRLKVYLSPGQAAASDARPQARPSKGSGQSYTIRRGDTLWSIARLYPGVSADDLKRFNDLRDERSLRPGKRLRIPESE
ncbi:MAG: LysM peptidoglycan-binding domain-containing protein [Acidobacteriota bacterium]